MLFVTIPSTRKTLLIKLKENFFFHQGNKFRNFHQTEGEGRGKDTLTWMNLLKSL